MNRITVEICHDIGEIDTESYLSSCFNASDLEAFATNIVYKYGDEAYIASINYTKEK